MKANALRNLRYCVKFYDGQSFPVEFDETSKFYCLRHVSWSALLMSFT